MRAEYTEVWVAEQNVPLARFAARARSIGSTGLDLIELGMADDSILRGFDEIFSWYGTGRIEFRQAVSHLPFRFFPALPPGGMHAVDFYLNQVGAPLGAVPRFPVERWDGGFVAVHPYSGSQRKNWPVENFQELARRMKMEWCHERFSDLHDLAKWLAGARLFVGNDSGIGHLAAAVGTPVVSIFGPTDPEVWAPRGARVVPMEATVDEVERIVIDCLRCGTSS